MLSRRRFFGLVAAPAIVRAASLDALSFAFVERSITIPTGYWAYCAWINGDLAAYRILPDGQAFGMLNIEIETGVSKDDSIVSGFVRGPHDLALRGGLRRPTPAAAPPGGGVCLQSVGF